MKNKNNIDEIFRGKLEGFSVSPPPHVWENVKGQLAAKRRKARQMYVAWISTAALVVLAFLAGWHFNRNDASSNGMQVAKEIAQPEKKYLGNDIEPAEIAAQISKEQSTKESMNTNHSNSTKLATQSNGIAQAGSANIGTDMIYASREIVDLLEMKRAEARIVQSGMPTPDLAVRKNTVPENYLSETEQLLIAANIKNMKASEKPDNNWKMGMFVAPGYSSYTADHTESYSKNMTYTGNDGNSNVGGGISVQYKTSKRWIVESGVYYAQNGQESNHSSQMFAHNMDALSSPSHGGSSYFSNTVRVENSNLAMNSMAGVVQLNGTPKGAEIRGDFEAMKSDVGNLLVPNGSFSQVFQFMEIPLLIRYRLVDAQLGVELISGFNAGIVVGNNAYIDNQYGLQNIGQTQDISPINISGTVGVGVNYALSKHFAVAIEPRFNYYLNSINTSPSVDFRPYRLGFYTGISYEF
jgi:hypothetical protein